MPNLQVGGPSLIGAPRLFIHLHTQVVAMDRSSRGFVITIKLFLCFKHHTMKTYGGVEV